MTCPKCGAELKDGNLLCEKCGEEINYVPDFDPEIEQSISETLSELQIHDIADSINVPAMDEELDKEAVLYLDNYSENNFDNKSNNNSNNNSGEDLVDYSGNNSDKKLDEDLEELFPDENPDVKANSEFEEETEDNRFKTDAKEADFETEAEDAGYEIDIEDELYDDEPEDGKDETYDDEPEDGGDEIYDDEPEDGGDEIYDDESEDGEDEIFDDEPEDGEYDDYDEYDFDYELYDEDDDDYEDVSFWEQTREWLKSTKNKVLFGILLAVLIFAIIIGVKYLQNYIAVYQMQNSYMYHMNLAQEYAVSGNYISAVEEMEIAVSLNPEDSSLKFALADYYFAAEDDDKAILLLWDIIYAKQDNYWLAYQQIVNFYVEKQDYNMVRDILDHCDDSSVLSYFTQYLANAPEFNMPEGVYEDSIMLQFHSDTAGTIYYTLDGTEPTKDSEIYQEPILLKFGTYEVNAFFVNQYGVESDVVSLCYRINSQIPDAPVCITSSGDYLSPELIVLEPQEECTFYYTLDGSTPTMNSREYLGPIPMPVGTSHFCFVAYNENGVYGEVSEYDYYLILESDIDLKETIDILHRYDFMQGKTNQLYGTMTGGTAKYSYTVSSAIQLEEENYYIIEEYLEEPNGNTMLSGNLFLVNVSDGCIYQTEKDMETGLPMITGMITPDLYTEPASEPEVPPETLPVGEEVTLE